MLPQQIAVWVVLVEHPCGAGVEAASRVLGIEVVVALAVGFKDALAIQVIKLEG